MVCLYLGACFYSIFKSADVKHLPRWAWALICVISVPLGGILYFILGRDKYE
ncbi:PLDc N-terminal domain-containing protein [Lactococcus formosensis]|nr:PLDc N-terminal domain-containing protein [Lactococcus formosensis]MCO7180062.1 PLDc N-terminal domain-containing protein [Lactococcus formosensis]